jgi:hypothetical protein
MGSSVEASCTTTVTRLAPGKRDGDGDGDNDGDGDSDGDGDGEGDGDRDGAGRGVVGDIGAATPVPLFIVGVGIVLVIPRSKATAKTNCAAPMITKARMMPSAILMTSTLSPPSR